MNITVINIAQANHLHSPDLLTSESCVKLVIELFDLEKLGVTSQVTIHQMEQSDLLGKFIRDRYWEHLRYRVKKKSLHSHWSMKLALQNLSVSAAYMILSGHMAIDLECFTESDGLLASHTTNFFHASRFPDREGCYLHYDKNRGCFVRSGKVNGRGVTVRDSEHLVGAKARSASSHFYCMYPSLESPRATKRGKQGLFENLQQIIAVGYDPSSDLAQNLHKDWNKGGLLILSEKEKKEIKGSMGKKLTYMVVSYQLEFGYDLAICPGLNISRSPVFEYVLGAFGGEN
jgi:hypothetical protein